MHPGARVVEVRFEWKRLAPWVDVRFTDEGKRRFDEAASNGVRIPPDERHELLTYSFSEVRKAMDSEPGVYLVEAFHTDREPLPDPGSMTRADWREVADHYHELNSDPTYEEPQGGDPLWFYIGMAGNLKERFEDHEQSGSALMRELQRTVAAEDAWMRVSIQRDQEVIYSGQPEPVDLCKDLVRVLLEHAAIADYRRENPDTPMVNIEKVIGAVTPSGP